jgi:hypothetical protein
MNRAALKKMILLIFPALLAVSCVSMNTEISIDGTGRVRAVVDYTVSRYVVNFGRTDSRDPFIPLPITRDDFAERSRQIQGSNLESHSVREDEDALYVKAVVTFRNLKDMGIFFSIPMEQSARGNGQAVLITVIDGTGTDITQETWDLVTPLFKDDVVTVTVNTPATVISHSHGELSRDKKTVVFKRPMLDLLKTKGKLDWEIVW